ncbi:hypothetical protein CHH79_16400 [Bacillus siamensis]|nr:hypothetical protein CHH79_16400 [Bacillus siamensis]PIK31058.1 hypothetical protein CS954_09915 [Bacillus siamensis]
MLPPRTHHKRYDSLPNNSHISPLVMIIIINDNYNLIIFPSAVNTVLLFKAVIRGPYTKFFYNQSIKNFQDLL